MLLDYIRVLLDTGTVSDKSLDNQDDSINTTIALDSSSYIYVAQRYPFTNLFLHSHVANAQAATLSAQYWDGTTWRDAVDFLDGTTTSGATLAKSGLVHFTTNRLYSWHRVHDTSMSGAPDELSSFNIYNCYWLRLKVSATLTVTTALKEITYAFTSSQELRGFDTEIDSYFTAFSSTKADWHSEIITASKLLISDLKRLGLIGGAGQIIDLQDFYIPTSLKTIELIYSNLGPSYSERAKKKLDEYEKSLGAQRFTIDENADGQLDQSEFGGTIRRMVR